MNLDSPAGPVLYLSGVTVTFDGFRALDSLSLLVEPGELRCVIGPNGAGKTTLMDVITGRTRPDVGDVHYGEAHDLARMSEAEIVHAGIGRKFQKPTIFRASRRRASTRCWGSSASGARRGRSPTSCPTARSSGWRSACCWSRTRASCSWTSRSRG